MCIWARRWYCIEISSLPIFLGVGIRGRLEILGFRLFVGVSRFTIRSMLARPCTCPYRASRPTNTPLGRTSSRSGSSCTSWSPAARPGNARPRNSWLPKWNRRLSRCLRSRVRKLGSLSQGRVRLTRTWGFLLGNWPIFSILPAHSPIPNKNRTIKEP